MATKIRVLIGDNHPIFRAGLRTTLATDDELQIIGEIGASPQIYSWLDEPQPDVVLLAANLPGFALPDTVIEWNQRFVEAKFLVLLQQEDEVCSRRLIESGAAGCLLKNDTAGEFIQAIHTVVQGNIWFKPTQLQKAVQSQIELNPSTKETEMTVQEQAILHMIAAEKTNQEIALALGVSNRTACSYLTSIFNKLAVQTRVGAVAQAFRQGLLS